MAFESLGTEITAFCHMQDGTEFPFLTMPLFEANAHHAREQSGAEIITLQPLVRNDQREAWETYSQAHQDWLQTSRDLLAEDGEHFDPQDYSNEPITPFIHSHDENGDDIPASYTDEVSLNTA